MASKHYNKSQQPPLLPSIRHCDSENEIKDNKFLIYWIAMLLGCGILTSYNYLVSAPDYFSQQYINHPNLNMLIVPAYTIPDVLFLILAVLYGHLFSFTSRIVICFVLMGMCMFFPILTQYIITSQDIGFYIILSVSAFCGLTTAVLQTSIIGFCNYLPVNYIQVSISGQSMAGIIAGVNRIGINFIETYTEMNAETNGMIYFAIGGVIDILCGISFLFAIRSAFVKFHLSEYFWTRKFRGIHKEDKDAKNNDLLQRTDTQTILRKLIDDTLPTPNAKDFESVTFPKANNNETQVIGGRKETKTKKKRKRTEKEKKLAAAIEQQQKTYMKYRENTHEDESEDIESNMTTDDDDELDTERVEITRSTHSTTIQSGTICTKSTTLIVSIDDNMKENVLEYVKENKEEAFISEKVTYFGVFKKIKVLAISIFLVFFVTFLVFPGMVTSLESEYKWVNDNHWMPVWLVLEFNVMDFIGRQFIAAYTSLSFSKKSIWIGCFWRIILYPLFVVMYKGIIKNDVVAYVSVAILGITNGHFCCLIFMWAPSLVTSNEQQLCGSIMSFALVMGITLGSNLTLLLSTIGLI